MEYYYYIYLEELNDHILPISCVSFSPDGSILVSYSSEEGKVKIWKTGSTGFLGGLFDVQVLKYLL